jgi:ethanolamine kinase
VKEYIKAYFALTGERVDEDEEVRKLMTEVDVFRGVPGFYWGIWSSIQAVISKIDFDYAQYAELRLSEYWAYKAEEDGSRKTGGREMPLREQTWWRTE